MAIIPAVLACIAFVGTSDGMSELFRVAPALHALVQRAKTHPAILAEELRLAFPATVAQPMSRMMGGDTNSTLPLVVAHGMGDSCFNPGMQSITKAAGDRLGVYSTCIPTGDNLISDTINGFLLNMDKSVEVFAEKVRADPLLAGGFKAFGLSQGNNVIRGYMAKYNDPPVTVFMSICGINAGVAAFPQCAPSMPVIGGVCEALTEALGSLAYLPIIQSILFQANYFRDPERLLDVAYLNNSQLAAWNGETGANMTQRKLNWMKTSKFVWVEGTKDTVVWPREGEVWGALTQSYPANMSTVPMQETPWYKFDTFGLRAADEAGKNAWETFDGQHIRFTQEELQGWLDKYFTD